MTENFPHLEREVDIHIKKSCKTPKEFEPRQGCAEKHYN